MATGFYLISFSQNRLVTSYGLSIRSFYLRLNIDNSNLFPMEKIQLMLPTPLYLTYPNVKPSWVDSSLCSHHYVESNVVDNNIIQNLIFNNKYFIPLALSQFFSPPSEHEMQLMSNHILILVASELIDEITAKEGVELYSSPIFLD